MLQLHVVDRIILPETAELHQEAINKNHSKIYYVYVTGFWKISLNVTFYNSNIYNQNEEWKLPINLKVVTICSKIIGNT